MYNGKVELRNKMNTRLALENDFEDTFDLIDNIKKSQSVEEALKYVNIFERSGYTWTVDHDDNENTRFKRIDRLGNVHYLIVYKKVVKDTFTREEVVALLNALGVKGVEI